MKTAAVLSLLLTVTSARTLPYVRRASNQTSTNFENLQTFTGDLGAPAPVVVDSGDPNRPFEVNGNTFVGLSVALQRSCDIQFNQCANKANAGANFTVAQCQTQKDECSAAAQSATKRKVRRRVPLTDKTTPKTSGAPVGAISIKERTGNVIPIKERSAEAVDNALGDIALNPVQTIGGLVGGVTQGLGDVTKGVGDAAGDVAQGAGLESVAGSLKPRKTSFVA